MFYHSTLCRLRPTAGSQVRLLISLQFQMGISRSTDTLSPSSSHSPHNCCQNSTCARGPRDPTYLCHDHFSHLLVNPTKTNSKSVTKCRGTPRHLLYGALTAAVSSALVVDCLLVTGKGGGLIPAVTVPKPNPIACKLDPPRIS